MCLGHSAHGLVPTHEIFQKPFPVEIVYETAPTPENYASYYSGRGLASQMKVWRVQTSDYRDNDAMEPGVVAGGNGFADSADAEVIAGGLNQKGPNAVALGRHGSFFHWGFQASPKDMTEAGKRAFLNSVYYIRKFDRHDLLVRKVNQSRDYALDTAHRTQNLAANHRSLTEAIEQSNAERLALVEKAKTQKLTPDEEWLAGLSIQKAESFEDYSRSHFDRSYPRELVARLGTEGDRYLEYFEANLEYLRPAQRGFEVDEDAKALGISNRSIELLEQCISRLERGEDVERAQRLLERYTDRSGGTAAEWRTWFDGARSDLFFSDVGGFRFFTSAPSGDEIRRRVRRAPIDPPTQGEPVSIHAEVVHQSTVDPGVVTLAVRVVTAPGWHIYAAVPRSQPYTQTNLGLQLPPGAQALGDWDLPPATPSIEAQGLLKYEGDLVFLRRVKLGAEVDAESVIGVDIDYQVCDANQCLPPARATRAVPLGARTR